MYDSIFELVDDMLMTADSSNDVVSPTLAHLLGDRAAVKVAKTVVGSLYMSDKEFDPDDFDVYLFEGGPLETGIKKLLSECPVAASVFEIRSDSIRIRNDTDHRQLLAIKEKVKNCYKPKIHVKYDLR